MHALVWLPTLAAMVVIMSLRFGGLTTAKINIFMWMFLCIAMPMLLFLIISVIGKCISFGWQPALLVGNCIGLAVGVVMFFSAIYGLTCGWNKLDVRQVELSFDNLPKEFDGYRIIQLSDLHVGSYDTDATYLERLVATVNSEGADLIVFTGDIVNTSPKEIAPFVQTLSKLNAPDGVISVLGNHDYCLYGLEEKPKDPRDGAREVVRSERRMNWDVLLNEHRIIERDSSKIAIVGVENTGKPPFPKIGDLPKAMSGIPDGTFAILLSHDPSHWQMEVLPNTDIPLMLAGHTHAAQLKIGSWSPAQWMYKEWSGLYTQGSQRLYVSEGVGGGVPFRLGATSEIIVFTLHRGR